MDYELSSPFFIICRLSKIVEKSKLEDIIRELFLRNIGPSWTGLLKVPKSRWTFQFMLEIINQHWNAVFSRDLPNSARLLAIECLDIYILSRKSNQSLGMEKTRKIICSSRDLLLLLGLDISSELSALKYSFSDE